MAIDTSFLDQMNKFGLIVNKRVTSIYSGPRKSIAAGRGISFKDHRMYSPGDEIRLINWSVYARTNDLYIKNFEEERNLTVHILLDSSESMNFGKKYSKFDYGAMIGIGFAYLALKENEKFQLSTFAENIEIYQAKKGMSQLAAVVHHLNGTKTKGISKMLDSLMHYRKFIKGRSMVVLISDFLVNIDEIKETLYRIGRHDVKIIHILDPVEKNLSLQGDNILKDSETLQQLRTNISPRLRVHYQELLDKHAAEIEKICLGLGYHYHQITTDKPLFEAFYEILA